MLERLKSAAKALAIVFVLATLIFGRWVGWKLMSPRTLAIVIVDKTVPFPKYREHAFLVWFLHTSKITGPDGVLLEPQRDYVGYVPVIKESHDLDAARLANADTLFIADTYGVYRGDYERPGEIAALERSPLIYGGLTEAEASAIEAFSAKGKLVIGEFNSFASPTSEGARKTAESTFGVRWTHWVGRYWPDLQDPAEVPRWVGRVYEKVYKKPFTITGAGFVFVRDDEDMIVLEAKKHLTEEVIALLPTADKPPDWPGGTSYWYWLDVVESIDADVYYEHVMALTSAGERLMDEHKVPRRFPALTKRHGRSTYYLAGDFVDTGVELPAPERLFTLWWRRVAMGRTASPDERFLWGWYAPVLERLLDPRATPGRRG